MNEPEKSKELPLRSFNPKVMLDNIASVKNIISRVRQREGGIGSDDDELTLHRLIHDLDLLVDIVDGLKARYDDLHGQFSTAVDTAVTFKKQNESLKTTYEGMLNTRTDRIKELEEQYGLREPMVNPPPTPAPPPATAPEPEAE